MFRIVETDWLAPGVRKMVIEAPRVAKKHLPGHFVIVRAREEGERIPLTVADADPEAGTITLIIQAVGASTELLCTRNTGESLPNVAGPMGKPTELKNFGHVVLVGGGVGTAVIHPQAKALKDLGNRVSAIMGGRSKPYVILEEELARFCDAVYPCTDDGSYGYSGFVTGKLAELIESEPVDAVITAGPVMMMKAVAEVTRPHKIHTIASLNPIMVDGTGMCGGCRVMVDNQQKFACVDGPEFDAHLVDFENLADRITAYKDLEQSARERLHENPQHKCRLEAAAQNLGF